jgi:hypothetical protein
MAEPTLLQQARQRIDMAESSRPCAGAAQVSNIGIALQYVLQYLEERHANMSGPAQVPVASTLQRYTGGPAQVPGFEERLKASSLGTPDVEAVSASTPKEVVERILARADALNAAAAQVPSEPKCAECGGDRAYWPHSTTPPSEAMHHPFQPSGLPVPGEQSQADRKHCANCGSDTHAVCYSDPVTDAPLDLAELQRLCDRATRGPWRIDEDGDLRAGGEAPHGLCTLAVLRSPCPVVDNSCGVNEADVAFIAAARDALPKLIAQVRQLQADARVLAVPSEHSRFQWDQAADRVLGKEPDDAR